MSERPQGCDAEMAGKLLPHEMLVPHQQQQHNGQGHWFLVHNADAFKETAVRLCAGCGTLFATAQRRLDYLPPEGMCCASQTGQHKPGKLSGITRPAEV